MQLEPTQFIGHLNDMKYIIELIDHRSGRYWATYRINMKSMSLTKMIMTEKGTWGNVSVAPTPLKFSTFDEAYSWLKTYITIQQAA